MTTLSTTKTSSDSLLRLAMRADAVLSGLCGIALIVAAGPLSGFTGLPKGVYFSHRQLVLHHGLAGEAERTHSEAVKARCLTAEPQREGTGALVITGDGPRIGAVPGSS